MENYIVINGKKAELTEEQLKALGLEREIKSPFSKVNNKEKYYFITSIGIAMDNYDCNVNTNARHKVANYCTDREIMEQRALHETLNRLLWRYSMEHKGNEVERNDDVSIYIIYYDHDKERWCVNCRVYPQYFLGAPYFATMEIAESAIREIVEPFMAKHPDFKF